MLFFLQLKAYYCAVNLTVTELERRNREQLALLSRREAVGSSTGRYKDRTNTDGVDQKPGFPPANSILLSSKLGEAIIFHRVSFLPGP